jgi:hypothetical protein
MPCVFTARIKDAGRGRGQEIYRISFMWRKFYGMILTLSAIHKACRTLAASLPVTHVKPKK